MLSQQILASVPKSRLLEFLGLPRSPHVTKTRLVDDVQALLNHDANAMERLLNTLPKELAVGPLELQALLQCSRAERRRWIKEGRLPVLEYRPFRNATMFYPVHDRRVIQAISQDEVAQWREIHHAEVRERRKVGAQKAVGRRRANQDARQDFLLSWQRRVEEWCLQGSAELAVVFQLAYWTLWASRWAKTNHIKSLRGIKYADAYALRRDEWYKRKNEALCALAQTPYAQLSFYRPLNADKRHLWLCEEHYAMKQEEYYDDAWDFFHNNAQMVRACPQCDINIGKDYYSLYYIEVTAQIIPATRFAFHIPYPIGKAILPAPAKLPSVEHIEQESLFRFGRALFAHEKVTHREQDVLLHFEKALQSMQALFCSGSEF